MKKIEENVNKIRPYLKDSINDLKKSDTRQIKLAIAIDFMSSKNNDEEPVMHSKSDNIEITSHDKVDEFKEELFQSLLSSWKYQ